MLEHKVLRCEPRNDKWSEGYAHIVVLLPEVDFIASFKRRPIGQDAFHTCAGKPPMTLFARRLSPIRKRSESSWPRIKPEITSALSVRMPNRPVAPMILPQTAREAL